MLNYIFGPCFIYTRGGTLGLELHHDIEYQSSFWVLLFGPCFIYTQGGTIGLELHHDMDI